MAAKQHRYIITLFLIFVICANLANVQAVRADGETPTEPPAATEAATEPPAQPPVESTPEPMEATPAPEEVAPVSVEEILTQVPEATEVVVLDESGEVVPLVSEEAAQITEIYDPMWCPVVNGVRTPPGGAGCREFTSSGGVSGLTKLVNSMSGNTSWYDEPGIIYFESGTTDASFNLTTSTLSNFATLNDYNLILQGGWNKADGSVNGVTNFGTNSVTIGSQNNNNTRWWGNITLNNLQFDGGSSSSINIFTNGGSITLDNVDVLNKHNGANTAVLNSNSGNITIQNGSTFDGDGTNSNALVASTGNSASITITDTSITDIYQSNGTNNGAELTAGTVNLTNVNASNFDGDGIQIDASTAATLTNVTVDNAGGDGIQIDNANTVTLNSVIATNADENGIRIAGVDLVTLNGVVASDNGTANWPAGLVGNVGSGVFVDGNNNSRLIIIGGTFNNNQRYGIEVANTGRITTYVQSTPACTGNVGGCSNDTLVLDSTAPIITPNITGTAGSDGWYRSNVTVTWSMSDPESGVRSSSGCTTSNLTSETAGVTLTCSATNNANLTNSVTVTVKIDKTAPTATLSVTGGTLGNNGWYRSDVTVHTSGTDSLSPVTCTPDQARTTDTTAAGVSFSGSCTNAAGLTTNAASINIKLDKTNPTISFTGATPSANGNGWNNSNVMLSWSCTDAGSGPVAAAVSQTLSAQGVGLSSTGTCADQAGNTVSDTQGGINIDKTPPTLNLPPDITQNATSGSGAVVNYTASASDNLDLSPSFSCDHNSGSTFPLGATTVTCNASDAASNPASDSFVVNIQDPGGPVITVPVDLTTEATGASGAAVTFSASAIDIVDGPVAVSCDHNSGDTFPVGATTVTCSATDSSHITNTAGFSIIVQDTTAPTIAAHSDFSTSTTSAVGVAVNYSSPSTSDLVDGAGVASCLPASGSLFSMGDTQVTCTATDKHGNTATSKFFVHVTLSTLPPAPISGSGTAEAVSTSGTSNGLTIPLTGGKLINLDCNTVFWAFNVRLSFLNLCDQQTMVDPVVVDKLPGKLPAGFQFVMGVDLDILTNGQSVVELPDGTGIQMDFPAGSNAQFAVLYWDGSRWVEVSEKAGSSEVSAIIGSTAGNGLYHLTDGASEHSYPILTAHKIGIFVLVKK